MCLIICSVKLCPETTLDCFQWLKSILFFFPFIFFVLMILNTTAQVSSPHCIPAVRVVLGCRSTQICTQRGWCRLTALQWGDQAFWKLKTSLKTCMLEVMLCFSYSWCWKVILQLSISHFLQDPCFFSRKCHYLSVKDAFQPRSDEIFWFFPYSTAYSLDNFVLSLHLLSHIFNVSELLWISSMKEYYTEVKIISCISFSLVKLYPCRIKWK